jgi:hypothetical protein
MKRSAADPQFLRQEIFFRIARAVFAECESDTPRDALFSLFQRAIVYCG